MKDTSATLNASVNPNGQATTVVLRVRHDHGLRRQDGGEEHRLGQRLDERRHRPRRGLTPGTTYHFRVVATNAAGTNPGGDQTFTTTGPPVVHSGAATGVSSNGATLTGSVDPNGHSTSWYFEYGTATSYGTRDAGAERELRRRPPVSVAIGGLTPGTTYHFRLVGRRTPASSYGADAVFTTAGPAVTLAASTPTVIARHAVTLSRSGRERQPQRERRVFAQRYGSGSFTAVATVLTDADGTWRLVVRPPVGTTYKGIWNGSTSSTVTVAVRPAVTLRPLSRTGSRRTWPACIRSRGAPSSSSGTCSDGRWLTIARAHLNSHSAAIFEPKLKRGRSTLRVAISVNQAGGGYLAGFSTWVTVRRH